MRQEIAFFVNQHSGKGDAINLAETARAGLSGLTICSESPESAVRLTELCGELPSETTRAAVVFGGDGTLNFALRGLLDSEIPLYPYPSGTANDLAHENGITGDLNQLSRLLKVGAIRQLRVLRVNQTPFSTISGIGIGSRVCDEFNRMRTRFGWIKKLPKRFTCEIYSLLAMKTILQWWGKGHRIRLISEEWSGDAECSILMVCNQSTLGGNLRVAPDQTPDQEKFTVIFQRKKTGLTTLKALFKMKLGKVDSSFESFQTTSLRIESLSGEPLPVFGDGEILESSTTLNFGVHPKKVKVFSERHPGVEPLPGKQV